MVKIGTFRNWKSFPSAEFKWGLFMPCLIYKEQNENLNFIPTWLFPSNFRQITHENRDEISCWNSIFFPEKHWRKSLFYFWISSSRVMDRSHLEIFCVPGWQPVIAIGLTLTVAVIKVQVWISTSVWNVYKWQSPNLSWKKAEAEGNWMPAQALSLHCWALWGRLDCLPQAVSSRWQKRVHWPTCKKHWKLELT